MGVAVFGKEEEKSGGKPKGLDEEEKGIRQQTW